MAKATIFGWNPPFFGGAQNVLSRQEDDRIIKNDILQLISTEPGERVMRPEFGVPLRSFVFELGDDDSIESLRSAVQSAIESQDPRVRTVDVDTIRDDARNGLTIRISVTLKRDPAKAIIIEKFITART